MKRNQLRCQCKCSRQAHTNCANEQISIDNDWVCPYCFANEFPFNHVIDDKEYNDILRVFFRCNENIDLLRLNDLAFDIFSLNSEDGGIDLEHYDTPCQYYFSDEFNEAFTVNNTKENISLFHLNAQSFPSKYFHIQSLLASLEHKFDEYASAETWFEKNVPSMYKVIDYNCFHKHRESRKGGGVCLYINPKFKVKERPDLQFSTDTVDTLFIELERETKKNIIVGVIYKAPNSNSDEFIDSLSICVEKISNENKQCYLTGDFNFDLLKHSSHEDTERFLNTLLSCSLRPLITKPTCVTTHSSTCIDNVFTNVKIPLILVYCIQMCRTIFRYFKLHRSLILSRANYLIIVIDNELI